MNYDDLTRKKQQLDHQKPLPAAFERNLNEWFRVELTYTSNALEGNTLTRQETAMILEKGLTVGGKSLKEHLEATNHAKAVDYIQTLVSQQPIDLTENEILSLHQLILQGIDDDNAGRYRTIPVRIAGSAVILPNPRKVPELMIEFMRWLTQEQMLHPVALAGEAHYQLVTIHPFVDGNGRTARLLMNLLLMMQGYPPVIIRPNDRLAYLNALEKAQLGGAKTDYEQLIIETAARSLEIYLNTDQPAAPVQKLLKIGELAKSVNEPVPTIRHWLQLGLLEAAEVTPAGYQLFDETMTERCQQIKALQAQRLTLKEIKQKLIFPLRNQ